MVFLTILFIVWLVYAIFIIRFVRKMLTTGLLDIINEDKETAQKFDAFARKDIHKWNHLEMYLVAVFLFPIRIVHFLFGVTLCCALTKLALIGTHHTKELSLFRRTFIKKTGQILARQCLYAFGFYWIKYTNVNISDHDPSYPRVQALKHQGKPAPIIVSNHISWVDIFIYMTSPECPSFMAKHEVERYPLVGPIAQGLQCLFVERENKDQRGGIVAKLKERIENFERNPVTVPQVLIYPEGTTSNGEYIISFKKGAFTNFTPIKVYGLKYPNKSYSPAFDSLSGRSFLFTCLQLYNSVTIYDMGVYDPEHLNLKSEEDWTVYAKKIKEIMLKVLGYKSSEMGFADKSGYYKTLVKKKAE